MQISICLSMSGYNKGTFTPKERLVADLHLCICSFKTSGYIDPLPINPNPPALLTALASRQPLAQTIPVYVFPKGVSLPFSRNLFQSSNIFPFSTRGNLC